MYAPPVESIIQAMESLGYKVFRGANHDLNIVGIRAADKTPNIFNDLIVVFYRICGGWSVNYFPATTDPGSYWLHNPPRVEGTAYLKPGQYRGSHRIGAHRGQYEALTQMSPVVVARDYDLDDMPEYLGREEKGLFGINIHRANHKRPSTQVDKWSAGCQVIADPWDFDVFMALCRAGRHGWGNSFSYTLIEEGDL